VTVCFNVLQCVERLVWHPAHLVCFSALQFVAVCYSTLQCVLQCILVGVAVRVAVRVAAC